MPAQAWQSCCRAGLTSIARPSLHGRKDLHARKKRMTATCACGKASITVSAMPTLVGVCNCTNCKRRTGSAFGISAYFERSAVVRQEGTTAVYGFHHEEMGHDQERHFCSSCGTTLFWYVSSMPSSIGIAGGCFEEDALPEPDSSYRDKQRLPWVSLPSKWRRYSD